MKRFRLLFLSLLFTGCGIKYQHYYCATSIDVHTRGYIWTIQLNDRNIYLDKNTLMPLEFKDICFFWDV